MVKKTSLTPGEKRSLAESGFSSMVLGEAGGISTSPVWSKVAEEQARANDRILVIVELSGGNDGLNTVVPFTDDAYYNARPKLGIRKEKDCLKLPFVLPQIIWTIVKLSNTIWQQ